MSLLQIEGLEIRDARGRGLVCGVDLSMGPGATVGLVGESGSGKTLTARAAMGLLPSGLALEARRIRLAGVDVYAASSEQRRRLLGTQVGYVPQNTLTYLQPSLRVRDQIVDGYRTWHPGTARGAAYGRAAELLESVGIEDPARVLASFPGELSGGQRQRVNIAMALMGDPVLIVADEPTAALDSVTAGQVSELLADVARARGAALLLVSHDLSLVRAACDEICVLYAGRIVEEGAAAAVLGHPAHPYTRGLKDAVPRLSARRDRAGSGRLSGISGSMPSDGRDAAACTFAPRCSFAREDCSVGVPALAGVAGCSARHRAACLRASEIAAGAGVFSDERGEGR